MPQCIICNQKVDGFLKCSVCEIGPFCDDCLHEHVVQKEKEEEQND